MSLPIHLSTSSLLVGLESVCGDQQKGCASVDDSGSGRRDAGRAVLDGLVNTPVEGGGRGGGDGAVKIYQLCSNSLSMSENSRPGDGAGELAGVGAAEGEFTVGHGVLSRWLEGDTDDSARDKPLLQQVIRHCDGA